jgi:hypothetical protein
MRRTAVGLAAALLAGSGDADTGANGLQNFPLIR